MSRAAAALRPAPTCADCRCFVADAAGFEAWLPGVATLSSGHASVRSDDGYCKHHSRLVGAHASCPAFQAKSADGPTITAGIASYLTKRT